MAAPLPDRFHTVTPSFTFRDCRKAIEFYKTALGAEVLDLVPALTGEGTMHASIAIGSSVLMMGDEMPGENCCESAETLGCSPISLYVYVPDADSAFRQAVAAGGEVTMPVGDMFWGDRAGQFKDPFGYLWTIATHQKDLSKDEVRKGAEAFFEQMSKK